MELKVSSLKSGGLSPADCASDPEEKEISDEDDDDRNHKHRRRDIRSQSLERDTLEPVFTRSYRKRNKPFENGHLFRENESQGSETCKNYNIAPLDKDFPSKFDKRRPGMASISRMDLNQRIRSNQSFGEPGPGRGRGRDSGSWNQRDRFSSVDVASQMVQHGSITPGLFPGRGLPNVPNAQNASWNAFGLIPAIPNGGLEALHSISLQGTLRPVVNNALTMGIPRQRCRDFEERGFCLRGDMCPMEHGVNRIVVEDVQSLSQFNLPVSLPSAALVGATVGPGALPSVAAPLTTLMNSKSHGRSSKPGAMVDDGMGFNGAFSGSSAIVSGADLYDPDQPLWNNNGPETSSSLLALHSSKNDDTESFMSADTSEHHHSRFHDGADNESALRSTVTSQNANPSVWGRVGAKNRLEKTDLAVSTSDYFDNKTKEDQDALALLEGSSRQGKRIIPEDASPNILDSLAKTKSDTARFMRKSSQKAQRTLFVCGIPQKSNRRDALLSHFQKFGEVVDIYIPLNNERAFVQFSNREEAEAALRAPDAVMGNRFIKLWWANRDTIPDGGINNSSNVSATPRAMPAASVPPQLSTTNKGKDIPATGSEGTMAPPSESSIDHPKPSITNGAKGPPPLQKKLELEQLKEELRKKQELLAQKRNDFRRQLDKLEKQAIVIKGDVLSEPAAKRPKVSIASDAAKVMTPRSSNPAANMPSNRSETIVDKNKCVENPISLSPKTKTPGGQQESTGSKQPIRPIVTAGVPFVTNRYKLDNRSTAFRVIPPLPLGLANVDALEEHFSPYGDLSTVVLEGTDDSDGREVPNNCTALVTFTTRHSAERAFSNGKYWLGNKLQFLWATCSTSGAENIPSASKRLVDTDSQPAEKVHQTDSHKACASGNEEPETSERNSGFEHVEMHKVSDPSPASVPDENKSPKYEGSATSLSSKEESPETKPGLTTVSEEKESSSREDAC
ncbi:zinc finger CCCH domain-containing protein 41 [Euphorbia lathyris]|uniref:zinc finger CCCH domain-containing protein 41 n=1 Tax=Euphorbia lathyris TaxID=212925 RepID=UPI0033140A22